MPIPSCRKVQSVYLVLCPACQLQQCCSRLLQRQSQKQQLCLACQAESGVLSYPGRCPRILVQHMLWNACEKLLSGLHSGVLSGGLCLQREGYP